ncbi:MAG: tetratricopeptide repeat protein [Bacteroidota bacterium]
MNRDTSLANIYRKLEENNPDEAMKLLEQHVNLFPNDPEGFLLKGMLTVQRESAEGLNEAEKLFQRVLELQPESLLARFYLGHIRIDQNRPEEAELILTHVLEALPKDDKELRPDTLLFLGMAQWQQGDRYGAVESWLEAYRIDPESKAIQEILKEAINEYGLPKAKSREEDDREFFQLSQVNEYLSLRNKTTFDNDEEMEHVINQIDSYWEQILEPEAARFAEMTTEEKITFFKLHHVPFT